MQGLFLVWTELRVDLLLSGKVLLKHFVEERDGSLDSAIAPASSVPNDFAPFLDCGRSYGKILAPEY